MNTRALGEFISCGAVWRTARCSKVSTLCRQLRLGSFRNGSLESKSSYFHPREWEEQETLDPETYYGKLQEAFTQNLPRYFGGQERIAMSLTGGLAPE